MSNTVHTYVRALGARSDLATAAGAYENKTSTKILQGLVAVLTLGLGYGVILLFERYHHMPRKIDEFCEAASPCMTRWSARRR